MHTQGTLIGGASLFVLAQVLAVGSVGCDDDPETTTSTGTAAGGSAGATSTATGGTAGSAASGGSGGVGGAEDTIPPQVLSTSPVADGLDVATDTVVSVTFDEDMAQATLSSASFTLEDAQGQAVAGSVVSQAAGATLTPDSALLVDETYTARLTTAVTDLAGNPLAAEVSWSFEMHAATWATAGFIEANDTGTAELPRVAVDAAGNAVVVWMQRDASATNNCWSNRYAVGTGWGTAEPIENDASGTGFPQIAGDPAGNALAVWHQGAAFDVLANGYEPGSGWATPASIKTNTTEFGWGAKVAMAPSGEGFAVWEESWEFIGTPGFIWSSRYVPGTGWGPAEIVDSATGNPSSPRVAVDPLGNAITVWGIHDGTRTSMWSNRYVVGTGWGIPELIETTNDGSAETPQVTVDADGNGVAVWSQSDGSQASIWSNRYVVGTGWGTAELIEGDDVGHARNPQVAVDLAGHAVVVWYQDDGTRFNIWSNRYVVGTGWGTAELIESDDAGRAWYPQVAVDRAGHGVAVWEQSDGTRYNIWSNRYRVGSGWGSAELIETDDGGHAERPHLGLDASGRAVVVWHQRDGTHRSIAANRLE